MYYKSKLRLKIIVAMGYNPYNLCDMKNDAVSFRPEKDVARMLERARKDGIQLTHIFNNATRRWLISKGYARKKEQAAGTIEG